MTARRVMEKHYIMLPPPISLRQIVPTPPLLKFHENIWQSVRVMKSVSVTPGGSRRRQQDAF